jgi:hypothetical protein
VELLEYRVGALEDVTSKSRGISGASDRKIGDANSKISVIDSKLDSLASAAAVAE